MKDFFKTDFFSSSPFVNGTLHTHSERQNRACCTKSGASDYAVKPNQFPVFSLMDVIIVMDLKQVSVPPLPPPPQPDTHMWTLKKEWSLRPPDMVQSTKIMTFLKFTRAQW